MVSFVLNYTITPKLSWRLKTEAFAIKYGNSDGLYTDTTLAMEYRIIDNLGLGLGLGSNALNVTNDDSDGRFSFDNRISGFLLYTTAYF